MEPSQQTGVGGLLAQQEWKVHLLLRLVSGPALGSLLRAQSPIDRRLLLHPAALWRSSKRSDMWYCLQSCREVVTPALHSNFSWPYIWQQWKPLIHLLRLGLLFISAQNQNPSCNRRLSTINQRRSVDSGCTWSSLLVCRRRCRRKWKREHFRTRMRSVLPSARWAEGERPLGLRGHAQLMQAALMARNFPWITLQLSSRAAVSTTRTKKLANIPTVE